MCVYVYMLACIVWPYVKSTRKCAPCVAISYPFNDLLSECCIRYLTVLDLMTSAVRCCDRASLFVGWLHRFDFLKNTSPIFVKFGTDVQHRC